MNDQLTCSLDFTHVSGRRVSADFIAGAEEAPWPGSPFRDRLLQRAGNGWQQPPPVPNQLWQRRLTGPVAKDDWAPYDLIDNEIRIGLHLIRAFGHGNYPPELSQLYGYEPDTDEPFVLLLPYLGEPVEHAAGRMKLDQERGFEVGFFRALRLLDAARVVHGAISPVTVRWDGSSAAVQLVDFSSAALAGEPRPGPGRRPWAAPGALAAAALAEPADDVWSAGLLTYHVTTGRRVKTTGQPPDLSVRGGVLRSLLDGVFAEATADRPAAVQLLERLRAPDPWPAGEMTVDDRFALGSRRFDELTKRKSPAVRDADEWRTAPRLAPQASRRSGRFWAVGFTVVALIVVGGLIALGVR